MVEGAITHASERNLLEVAAVLLAHGSIQTRPTPAPTPLMLATCEGHTDMCELLLLERMLVRETTKV